MDKKELEEFKEELERKERQTLQELDKAQVEFKKAEQELENAEREYKKAEQELENAQEKLNAMFAELTDELHKNKYFKKQEEKKKNRALLQTEYIDEETLDNAQTEYIDEETLDNAQREYNRDEETQYNEAKERLQKAEEELDEAKERLQKAEEELDEAQTEHNKAKTALKDVQNDEKAQKKGKRLAITGGIAVAATIGVVVAAALGAIVLGPLILGAVGITGLAGIITTTVGSVKANKANLKLEQAMKLKKPSLEKSQDQILWKTQANILDNIPKPNFWTKVKAFFGNKDAQKLIEVYNESNNPKYNPNAVDKCLEDMQSSMFKRPTSPDLDLKKAGEVLNKETFDEAQSQALLNSGSQVSSQNQSSESKGGPVKHI